MEAACDGPAETAMAVRGHEEDNATRQQSFHCSPPYAFDWPVRLEPQMHACSLSGLTMQVDKSDPNVYNAGINKF
jgi:hypothetical protein